MKSPQWLRNIKDRNYPWWRIDRFFSDTKYSNIEFFNKGGWHFSYVKDPKNIEKKLKWELSRDNEFFPHLYGFIHFFDVKKIELTQ